MERKAVDKAAGRRTTEEREREGGGAGAPHEAKLEGVVDEKVDKLRHELGDEIGPHALIKKRTNGNDGLGRAKLVCSGREAV